MQGRAQERLPRPLDFFTALFTQPVPRGTSAVRRLARYARYTASEKGRARNARYEASRKGRERVQRYRNTGPGSLARFRADLNSRMSAHAGQLAALKALALHQ